MLHDTVTMISCPNADGQIMRNSERPFEFGLSSRNEGLFCLYLGSVTIDKQANSIDFGRNGLDHALFIRKGCKSFRKGDFVYCSGKV